MSQTSPVTETVIEAACKARHSPQKWGRTLKNPEMAGWINSHRAEMRMILTAAFDAAGLAQNPEVLLRCAACGTLNSFEPSEIAQRSAVLEALTLAEDVLSRRPFSTGIWPNGMHPQTGIDKIRDAIKSLSHSSTLRWPAGCLHPGSCSRHGQCMYASCIHDSKKIETHADSSPDRVAQLNTDRASEPEEGRRDAGSNPVAVAPPVETKGA